MDLPVTIVIKAPNQRIDDQTVDCMLDWTVRKLKQHLTDVYPSKPKEQHQKLIYSGKLLQDHLTLKEVLRQFEDGSTKHTVHLVCSGLSSNIDKQSTYIQESHHSRQSSSSSTQSQGLAETDGIRHRSNRNPSATNISYSNIDTQNVFNSYSPQMPSMDQFAANYMSGTEAAMYPGMMPGTGMAYSPEQYMWMQQMYTQYMAQYMQYYQQGGYQIPNVSSTTPEHQQQQQQQQGGDVLENRNNDNIVNDDDADEEFRQRDWLDYLYTFSRFMVLLGIVYYYSSLSRFLMVAAFFIIVYAYQMGWFTLQRRRGRNVNIQQQNVQNIEPRNVPAENDNEIRPENVNPDETDSSNGQVPAEEPPREPGALQITWTFVSTFFTSLFPQPPPAVNVN
ncbi:Homocysteine-responsive endoplasmic reticulum-resident ubiquitin-like domain member 1 protein [Mactra antiquata]